MAARRSCYGRALACLVACACAVGCGQRDPETPGDSVSRSVTDGPVTLSIRVTPGELPFDQQARVVIEAVAESPVTVELRDYQALLREAEKQFEVRAVLRARRDAAPTGAETRRWVARYDLEFFVPGEYELPGAALTYVPMRTATERSSDDSDQPVPEPELVTTEPLPVFARETATAQASVERLDEIETLPPVELREPWRAWWVAVAAAVLLLLGGAIWWLRRGRAAQAVPEIRVPAHEWARRQIALLMAEQLVERGRVQEFHYRISDILRGYIERRYDVRAREMTTEEFLAEAAGDARFGSEATLELNRFLTACDMVKYARLEADRQQADSLLETARGFVERTREPADEESTASALQGQEQAA